MKQCLITKTDYEGALAILHHSTKEKELKRAQETIKQYKKQHQKKGDQDASILR